MSLSAASRVSLSRGTPVHARSAILALAGWAVLACGTMLPLESYEEAPEEEHPTDDLFLAGREEVWGAVLETLGSKRVPIELANEARGTVSTGWVEAPSLRWRRRRLGDRSEGAGVPLPARYRLDVALSETEDGVRVTVVADEETNFLILTGVDTETGLGYYRDDWRRTPTRTVREHEFLSALRQAIRKE